MHLPLRRFLIFPPVERRSINSCQKDPLAGNGRRDYFRRGRHMCRQFWDFFLRCHFRVQLLVCDCYVIVWTGRNTCKRHHERQHSRSSGALLLCVSLPSLEGSVRSQLRSGLKTERSRFKPQPFFFGLEHSEHKLIKKSFFWYK